MPYCRLPWWLSGKEPACQCRRCGFDPWVRKTPWRRKWQPAAVFWSPMVKGDWQVTVHRFARVRHNLATKQQMSYYSYYGADKDCKGGKIMDVGFYHFYIDRLGLLLPGIPVKIKINK